MSGLAGILSSASADDMFQASLALGKIDPVRELGLDLEMAQYNTRLETLSDPKTYAAKRQTAFDDFAAVAQDLIESGHGAWQADNTTLYVYVKTPADWAAVIYEFVSSNGLQGAIYTLYELHSGDLTRATSIQGMEPTALLRALELLERAGKAQVFPNDESIDETGVKFV